MSLLSTKTFWTGVSGVLGAVGAYLTGEIDLAQAAQMALTGLVAIFLRQGLVKSGGK